MSFFIHIFNQVKKLHEIVSLDKRFENSVVKVKDEFGSMADARSLLGMMSLNYNSPVTISCDSKLEEVIADAISGC